MKCPTTVNTTPTEVKTASRPTAAKQISLE
jgi:hypothetical protein